MERNQIMGTVDPTRVLHSVNYASGSHAKKRCRQDDMNVTADGTLIYDHHDKMARTASGAVTTTTPSDTTTTATTTTASATAAAPPSAESVEEEKWDDATHRDFVSAIFDVGMANASPAIILENMVQKSTVITSERIKSKLQKYRKNKDKSKADFMDEYDTFCSKIIALGESALGSHETTTGMIEATLHALGRKNVCGGDAAAAVTYIMTTEDGRPTPTTVYGSDAAEKQSGNFLRKEAVDFIQDLAGAGIPFPVLTEEEKDSALGKSMLQTRELFQSMSQILSAKRSVSKLMPTLR